MSVFDRYAPFVQDFIYQHGWDHLRAVQVAAADVLFHTDDHLLLCASTASGKTEAAFFPILSLFHEQPPRSVGALYIAPLKALINDQFIRLNDLCEQAHIPVWHWHGDVSQSHKRKLLDRPSGILQITPESLEALLMHKNAAVPSLFGDLRFIVIDEIHSLIRGDRGGQTMCLIERLCAMAGVQPRRIGLSATLGDPRAVGRFLSHGTDRHTAIPKIDAKGTRWRLSMEHFYMPQSPKDGTESDPRDPGLCYIYDHTRGKKSLVFVNSREECETVTATLRQYSEWHREQDRFLIHHGNLSSAYRETAEHTMRDERQALTTITTATLELGIDIGRLERAFQIDAPATVSSFLQRMGRTGRRDLPPEMWFVMREEMQDTRALLPATIPWPLLQGIALIQLYREERFVEPPRLDRLPFSLLYHQTMSTLASCGELSPAQLASKVLTLAAFHRITQDDFRTMLLHLIHTDHIARTERGGLIVGLVGERQINSYKFYAVFKENEEYTVRSHSEEIGTIVRPPPVGQRIAIAGHVWVVEEVDHKRRTVYCTQIKGIVPAFFGLCPGDIHTRILERMKGVLSESASYPYLMPNAVQRLLSARETARQTAFASRPLIPLGGNMWCLLPWLGTYAFMALERLLKLHCAKELGLLSLEVSRPYFMCLTMTADADHFFRIVKDHAAAKIDPLTLIYPGESPVFEKYDDYLPPELVKKGFAEGVLDIQGMKERVAQW